MRKPRKPLRLRTFLRKNWLGILCSVIGVLFLLTGGLLFWASLLKIPDLSSLENEKVDQSLKIYDRTGTVLLYNLNNSTQRTVVPISSISQSMQDAAVASEDPTFYQNPGIDMMSIARAAYADITSLSAAQGGSTITQQVVKLTLLNSNKTVARKIEEWILALKLTRTLSKSQILELYLNQVPFGGEIYGVEQASETFFGEPASDLTVPQAAYLTAMLPAPSYLSPYGANKAELDARKNVVLERMYEHGYITAGERNADEAAVVTFNPPGANSLIAPHFVFYVEQYLENKYGPDVLEQGGWSVITTLNADLQAKAEESIDEYAASNAKNFNDSNMGMVAIDPTDGQILVMVGSENYFDTAIDGNYNVTLAARQPGSTFKPFEYSEAFLKGYTPDTVLFDIPTQFSTTCSPTNLTNINGCYAPVDFDNEFDGPMTLRGAIAQSRNVPSVEVLYLAGISDTLQLAKSMGITTLGDASQYGLPLALGGGQVTLLQMTDAYGAFAQNGVYHPTTAILEVKDANGNVIEDDSQPPATQVLPANVAEEINDVLSDPVARAPLGENEYLEFPGRDVAAKTGTTNDYKDAWTIGYTPNLVVGIWGGNDNDTPMSHNVAGFMVGPAWHAFMQYALTTIPDESFTRETLDESGLKPELQGDWDVPGSDGQVHNILYWVDPADPLGPAPTDPAANPQYVYWETALHDWLDTHPSATVNTTTPGTLWGD